MKNIVKIIILIIIMLLCCIDCHAQSPQNYNFVINNEITR